MTTTPADIANRALDALGVRLSIGDLQEGTEQAKPLLRAYGPALRQLFRAAHWNFARKQATLTLLQDSTGATTAYQIAQGMVATVGTGTAGMVPWLYEYAWPIDCVKARFVPMSPASNGIGIPSTNYSIGTVPLWAGQNVAPLPSLRPSPFLVTQDAIPNLVGQPATWNAIPDTGTLLGQGLTSQTVILTNQPQASLVYTGLITYPDQWDVLFSEAFVALLASRTALSLVPDRKEAVTVRANQIAIAKAALEQARISDGDEGWPTVDHTPDWLRTRASGGWNSPNSLGVLGYGWDSMSWGDGAVY